MMKQLRFFNKYEMKKAIKLKFVKYNSVVKFVIQSIVWNEVYFQQQLEGKYKKKWAVWGSSKKYMKWIMQRWTWKPCIVEATRTPKNIDAKKLFP